MNGGNMMKLTVWILMLSISLVGMLILVHDPELYKLGMVMYFGGFLVFALSVAKDFIDWYIDNYEEKNIIFICRDQYNQ